MFPSNEHVAIEIDENKRDICAQFNRLSKIGHKNNLVQLSHIGLTNRGTEIVTQSVNTTIDGIEKENGAIDAIEFGIQTHVIVEFVLHFFLLVLFNLSNDHIIEKKT